MNWAVAAVLTWIAFGLELGLRDLLAIGPRGIAPSFVLPLAVYLALWASPLAAWTSALAIGLLVDLTAPVTLTDGTTAIIAGPHALGYLLSAQLVLTLRPSMLRRNPIALVMLTMIAGGIVQLADVFVLVIRRGYDPIAIEPIASLMTGLGSAVYSGASALVLALVLIPLMPIMGFPALGTGQSRHFSVRRT